MARKIIQLIPANGLFAVLKTKGKTVRKRVMCLALIEKAEISPTIKDRDIWGVNMFRTDGSTLFFEENPDFVHYDIR